MRSGSTTPLGSASAWPSGLRSSVGLLRGARLPMCLCWGEDLVMVYNDAYARILGDKHPGALGRPAGQVWREIWPVVGPLLAEAQRGQGVYQEDVPLPMNRHGFLEETYFTFFYSPVRQGDSGEPEPPAGVLCTCIETTDRVVGQRRLATLRRLVALPTKTTSRPAAPRWRYSPTTPTTCPPLWWR